MLAVECPSQAGLDHSTNTFIRPVLYEGDRKTSSYLRGAILRPIVYNNDFIDPIIGHFPQQIGQGFFNIVGGNGHDD